MQRPQARSEGLTKGPLLEPDVTPLFDPASERFAAKLGVDAARVGPPMAPAGRLRRGPLWPITEKAIGMVTTDPWELVRREINMTQFNVY